MRAALLLVMLFAAAGCDLPYDQVGTLQRVRGGVMRVGIVPNEPWTRWEGEEPSGTEVSLVRQFADQLDAEIVWIRGGESELMEALERHELDLVAAGLTKDTPWKSRVALTSPYITTHLVVGAPTGYGRIEGVEGRQVAVRLGQAAGAYVRDKGGIPMPVEDPAAVEGLVAAERWELQAWERRDTGVELHENQHVLAVPPGENGWLVELEAFVLGREAEIARMLREGAR